MNGAITIQAPAAVGKNLGSWSAMLLGVFLSALASLLTFEPEQNRIQKHLEQQARQSAPLIQAELRSYENAIRGLSAFFGTQQQVTRDEFRQYINMLNFRQHYPGVRQVNFNGTSHSTNTNSFEISYVADTSDSRVEPRTLSNSGKAGTALYSGGQTSVRLLAGDLIINQPVYRTQMPIDTIEQRRSSLIGMLSVELDPSKLTNRFLNENISPKYYSEAQFVARGDHFSRKIPGQGTNSPSLVIIQSATSDAQKYHSLIPVEIADTFWALKLSTDKSLILPSRNQALPWVVLLTGLFISVLASALIYFRTWRLVRNHPRVTGEERESRHRDLALIEAQRLAKFGSWTFNPSSQQFFWPAETSIVLGFDTHVPGKSQDQFLRCIHPEDRESVSRAIKSVSERNESADLQFRIVLEDGSSRCLHAIAKLIADESESVVHGIVMDVSERKLAEQRLQLEHQVVQMTHAVDSLERTVTQIIETVCRHLGWAGGIFWQRQQVDELQPASKIQWASVPGSIQDFMNTRMISIEDESGIQDQIWQLQQPVFFDDLQNFKTAELEFPATEAATKAHIRSVIMLPVSVEGIGQGIFEFYSVSPTPIEPILKRLLISISSQVAGLLERKRTEKAIWKMATSDALTGLANRPMFSAQLRHAIAQASRARQNIAVICANIDRFKIVNDSLGHAAGDKLLRLSAERLRDSLRKSDLVARFGADEFAILLTNLSTDDAVMIAISKIRHAFAAPIIIEGQEIRISMSMGISTFPGDSQDSDTLLKNANIAMYRAKEQGGGACSFYSEQMNKNTLQRLTMERGLSHAIEAGQLLMHYQPKLSLREKRVTGVEALVRWKHPEKGLIPPGQFIPIAEETGLILPMGDWVLREACRQTREWLDRGLNLKVAVNISARQFARPEFLEDVKAALRDHDLAPGQLELEITESMMMQNPEQAALSISALRESGINLSIDDFGTGYSSLGYLKRFSVDSIKIDRSFVKDLPASEGDIAINRAVISLAHNMKLCTVAEGVETQEQLDFFRAEGCDEIQGFFFCKPIPGEEIMNFCTQYQKKMPIAA